METERKGIARLLKVKFLSASKRTLFFLIIIIAFCGFQSELSNDIDLEPGSILIYSVKREGQTSELIVTIEQLKPVLKFNYKITFDPTTSGQVIMTQNALENADKQIDLLLGGKQYLDNATSLWISKKSFSELVSGDSTRVVTNDGSVFYIKKLEDSVKKINVDDDTQYVNFIYAAQILKNDNNEMDFGYSYKILDDPDNPIILSMDLGWTIELEKIISPKS
jgi:hypothetical protein